MTDDLAREQRRAERAAPRYDAQLYGSCTVCGYGPTLIYELAKAAWAVCGHCETRWPIGFDLWDDHGDAQTTDDHDYVFDQLASIPPAPKVS